MHLLLATLAGSLALAEPVDLEGRSPSSFGVAGVLIRDDEGAVLGLAEEQYRVQIIERIRGAGFPVVGAEAALFGEDRTAEGRYQLGATVVESECLDRPGIGLSWCEIAVRWELYDSDIEAVIYEVTTRGDAEVDHVAVDTGKAGRTALGAAVDSLLTRGQFVTALERDGASVEDVAPSAPLAIRRCEDEATPMPEGVDALKARTLVLGGDDLLGSGFLISPDGFALTAAHVVEGRSQIDAASSGGPVLEAMVVRADSTTDTALIRLPGSRFPCVGVGSGLPDVGSDMWVVGTPIHEDLARSVSRGVVSGTPVLDEVKVIQTDAALSPGFSGGPAAGAAGAVLGVASAKLHGDAVEGISFIVPTRTAFSALNVRFGAESEDVVAREVQSGVTEVQRFVDDADPSRLDASSEGFAGLGSEKRKRRKMLLVGLTTHIVGWSVVATTWAWYEGEPLATRGTWRAVQATNLAGWGLVVGGAGVMSAPLLDGRPVVGIGGRF